MTSTARQVRTTVMAVNPRSAVRIGAAMGVCLFVAWMVASVLIYILLGVTGVWDRVNGLAGDLLGSGGVSTGMYFGIATVVGLLEVVVIVLFMPLAALLYNAVVGYVGGMRITVEEGVVVEPEEMKPEDTGAEGAADSVNAVNVPGLANTVDPVDGVEAETAAKIMDADGDPANPAMNFAADSTAGSSAPVQAEDAAGEESSSDVAAAGWGSSSD